MGGSGGGYFSGSWGPEELARRARRAEEEARDSEFETSVGKHLGSLLTEYNSRDVDGTNAVLTEVVGDIREQIDGAVTTLFGGSVSRHTYVNGISDIDALVLFSDIGGDASPRALKSLLASCLRDRYGTEAVRVGPLAVTVTLRDKTLQLLPALRSGNSVRIAKDDGQGWARIAPQRFAKALSRHNDRLRGKLVPCIKLVKAIMSDLPEKRRLTGYHVEATAINVFRGYRGPFTTKAMLGHFFEHAGASVLKPIRDTSGQSVHVDGYLGSEGSTGRRVMADILERIGRRIRNADGAGSVGRWMELFGA